MRKRLPLDETLIPVEWVVAKRSRERMRETLAATRDVLEAERCLVIFPSGRLSRRQPDGRLARRAAEADEVQARRVERGEHGDAQQALQAGQEGHGDDSEEEWKENV